MIAVMLLSVKIEGKEEKMIIYPHLIKMKFKYYSSLKVKTGWRILIFGLMLMSWSCFWRKQPFLYPRGPFFPLKVKTKINFPGTPLKNLIRQDDYLFWTTKEGELFAYQISERKIIWSFSFPPSPYSFLAQEGEKLYWGDGQGQIWCFNFAGEKIWQKDVGGKLTRPVIISSGHIYGIFDHRQLVALDKDSGQILWSYFSPEEIMAGPAAKATYMVFGGEKGTLFILSRDGKIYFTFALKKKISPTLFMLQERCYFSTEDNHYYALDLLRKRVLWKVNLGGEALSEPINWEKKIIVPLWSGVVFCLQSDSGEIKWWRLLPGRSDFSPTVAEDQVIISSQSSSLVAYELRNGQLKGTMDLGYTLRSNPVWVEPYIYLLAKDEQSGESFLVELEKEVKVTLRADPPSPQLPGEEVKIVAEAVGFYQPEYEFNLSLEKEEKKAKEEETGEIAKEETVQQFSPVNSWTWYPEQPGEYVIRVVVKDMKEKAEAKLEYVIKEKKDEERKEESEQGKKVIK